MTTGYRKVGEFCWINMLTPAPDRACEFFGSLLGWTFGEIPGMGYLIRVGGKDAGGLFNNVSPQTPNGAAPAIGAMVKVANADATVERVRALGGTAHPAFDIGDQGRMAVCFDPNGAEFDIWEGKKSQGTDADTTVTGAPSWFETITSDPAKAAAFYTALFGWTAEAMPVPDISYTTFKLGSGFVAGMLPITSGMGAIPSHWGVYFTVNDADASAREAARLGGTICSPPTDVPGVGRFAMLKSPQGVSFYVMAYA